MTLKKEILAALNSESATVKLNDISYLSRWTKSPLEDVDKLEITFQYITGIKGGRRYEIESRDYNGIIDEIEKYTAEYFADCAKQATSNIRNGYR